MSNECLHNLSPLLFGYGLPQQVLLPHLPHPHLLPDVAHRLVQVPDQCGAFALVIEKEHLDRQKESFERLMGGEEAIREADEDDAATKG